MNKKFHYKTQEELETTLKELGISIPLAKDTHILGTPFTFGGITLPNRMGIAPMEGADAYPNGCPSEFTKRRYLRLAEGGASIIWMEAVSIQEDGLSSYTQLYISHENVEEYKGLIAEIKETGMRANGYAPFIVMQANHSGRYSNPENIPSPKIAYRHPYLETYRKADDSCIMTDDELFALEEAFGDAALLAKEAGFDAIDVKCCHGYITSELTSAYLRPGPFGGSYENRTRMVRNGVRNAMVAGIPVVCRLGIYDGYPYPYGFGVDESGSLDVHLEEPIRLVKELYQEGVRLMNLTMGNPYATTHITRPFDFGKYEPDEHPLVGIARMCHGFGMVKQAVPEMCILGSAPSYMRQYADLYAAGCAEQGFCDGMLFGRLSFADPSFPNEVLHDGRIHEDHVCLTCGKCGDLIRSHNPTGCVIRDREVFMHFYRKYLMEQRNLPENFRG